MDGIINVYKEAGYTSFDVVAKLRGILRTKKIGHTGTLDPDAEGVLPVCIGKATKVCDYLTDKDKVYETVMYLGKTTDTQDMSGTVLEEKEVNVTEEAVRDTIASFVGKRGQIPPMYSALKVNGQKLCDLARAGITVERKEREIEIFSIEINEICLPRVKMKVHCSKGTYIRTLCHDIGQQLGCGACMEQLLRSKAAGFSLCDAKKLSEIEEIAKGRCEDISSIEEILIPIDQVLEDYPMVHGTKKADFMLKNGNKIPLDMTDLEKAEERMYRMYFSTGKFTGIFVYQRKGQLFKPVKMFAENN